MSANMCCHLTFNLHNLTRHINSHFGYDTSVNLLTCLLTYLLIGSDVDRYETGDSDITDGGLGGCWTGRRAVDAVVLSRVAAVGTDLRAGDSWRSIQ